VRIQKAYQRALTRGLQVVGRTGFLPDAGDALQLVAILDDLRHAVIPTPAPVIGAVTQDAGGGPSPVNTNQTMRFTSPPGGMWFTYLNIAGTTYKWDVYADESAAPTLTLFNTRTITSVSGAVVCNPITGHIPNANLPEHTFTAGLVVRQPVDFLYVPEGRVADFSRETTTASLGNGTFIWREVSEPGL
jgi:hypothetical protein